MFLLKNEFLMKNSDEFHVLNNKKNNRLKFKRFNDLAVDDINFDFHMHTLQTDGRDTIEDMVSQAEKIGLFSIAFTEHVNESSDWFFDFKKNINYLREKSNIKILIGIEVKPIDFDGTLSVSEDIIKESEMVIGSVHRYCDKNKKLLPLDAIPSMGEERAAEIEFRLAMGILKNESVDVLGHPFGVYSKYYQKFPTEYMREILIESLKRGKAIEINTKYNLYKDAFFDLLMEINPYVSIGSDAHSKNEIGRLFDMIRERVLK